jgi:hypothetical protein
MLHVQRMRMSSTQPMASRARVTSQLSDPANAWRKTALLAEQQLAAWLILQPRVLLLGWVCQIPQWLGVNGQFAFVAAWGYCPQAKRSKAKQSHATQSKAEHSRTEQIAACCMFSACACPRVAACRHLSLRMSPRMSHVAV